MNEFQLYISFPNQLLHCKGVLSLHVTDQIVVFFLFRPVHREPSKKSSEVLCDKKKKTENKLLTE